MFGYGKLELIDTETNSTVFETFSHNTIMNRAIAGFARNEPGLTWPGGDMRIVVGRGSQNKPEASGLTTLDGYVSGWISRPEATTKTINESDFSFTVVAEFSPSELLENGNAAKLTEAGIVFFGNSNNLFNRLMFRTAPKLSSGFYKYKIYTKRPMDGAIKYSSSVEVEAIVPANNYSIRLDWSQTTSFSGFRIVREFNGIESYVDTTSQYLIDAGFDTLIFTPLTDTEKVVMRFASEPAITPPSNVTINISNDPQPYPVTKTDKFACRIAITIKLGN